MCRGGGGKERVSRKRRGVLAYYKDASCQRCKIVANVLQSYIYLHDVMIPLRYRAASCFLF